MTTTGICSLCHNSAELQLSHIIPKFVGRHLKKMSALGYFRSGMQPDKREQDLEKVRLLCKECEGLLEKHGETPFASNVFTPLSDDPQFQSFGYEEWLRYFTISLAWRTVVTDLERFRSSYPRLAQHADKALETWRRYLLRETTDPGPYEHHLFFFSGEIDGTQDANLPRNYSEYVWLTVDHAIANSLKSVFVYTKFPGIAFWSTIHPMKAEGWTNTRILESGTMSDKQIAPRFFGDFVEDRIERMVAERAKMSERERERIRQAIFNDPDGVANSRAFPILLADRNRERPT